MFAFIVASNTRVQELKRYLALDKSLVMNILHMVEDVYMSCAPALDGEDDGERCISLDTWHGYACVERSSPHLRAHAREVAFVIKCGRTCWDIRADMLVTAVALNVWE